MRRSPLYVSKKMRSIFFEKGVRAEFGPQSTFSRYMPPKKWLNFIHASGVNSCGELF